MTTTNWFKNNCPQVLLFGIFIAFFILKLPYFNIHYFWDEAWVYGPAVDNLLNNGFGDKWIIREDLTRGHPVFFHLVIGSISKLLGSSVWSNHIAATLIAIGVSLSIYLIVAHFTSRIMGLLAAIALLIQSAFFSQSAMVLPEVLLAGLIILSFYYYSVKLFWYSALFASLAMLTKESASMLFVAVGIYELGMLVLSPSDDTIKNRINRLLILASGTVPFFLFLAYQKFKLGYFLYPEHLGMINFELNNFKYLYKLIYDFVFEEQGRYYFVYAIFISISFLSILNWKKKILLFLIGLTAVKVFFHMWATPDYIALPLSALLVILFLKFGLVDLFKSYNSKESKRINEQAFLLILATFSFVYFLFCSVNFFTLRYTLPLLVIVSIWLPIFLHSYTALSKPIIIIGVLLLMIPMMNFTINPTDGLGDVNPNYLHALQAQKSLGKHIVDTDIKEASFHANFTNQMALNNIATKMVTEETQVEDINRFSPNKKDFVIHSNFDERLNLDTIHLVDTVAIFIHKTARIDLIKIKPQQP